ncbi:bifunctional 5,10-methylenetetrahydrofolate dehydrogenase/5,10-methenyltetrahydrofolate cyclohydrolase [Tardiphaga robiniae]|uniref:Bifunctional protein FolD n=1 Tax=Tardiphaga robiniae TaxID=943830 RepID=A0A7G6U1M6_9BRAD|nr:tetrahydrofolate dehydrogenase/cyclohydrolase catalytic domain-containing protein [Tardiphaga robiniae]QND72908.1 bifunctional methylenetetrahydrofolate dehydrogenase/methenyltetrahydrofolate cyclohydrolase [Tardiphaga robiniae]
MVKIIDGEALAQEILANVADGIRDLASAGIVPGLATILVGTDPASDTYVKRKVTRAMAVGIRSFEYRLPASTEQSVLLALIDRLNTDSAVHGILVQLPLPPQIVANRVLGAIAPSKDVDGFHPVNIGRLSIGSKTMTPCTPLGCMILLDSVISNYRGLHAVVIGKSNIVGKPTALLLLERECTVTVTHIETRDLPSIVRTADIIVAAAGSPELVRGSWVSPGAVVIDVGINRVMDEAGRSRLVGDVALSEMNHARAVTPVPGGVGPMTIACLLSNTLASARMISNCSKHWVRSSA